MSSGIAGRPQEYGIESDTKTWKVYHGFVDHRSYFEQFFSKLARTANGTVGVKLMWSQICELAHDIARYEGINEDSIQRTIAAFMPGIRYIRLGRRDHLRQAVSLARAIRSGIWSSMSTAATIGCSEPKYVRADIENALLSIEYQERMWNSFLDKIPDAQILRLYYEDLMDNCHAYIRVHSWLNLETTGRACAAPLLKKQADEVTERWLQQYSAGE